MKAPHNAARRFSASQQLGNAAEERACRLLACHGLRIVARNVRYRLGEIDVVAQDGGICVFVEVRSRVDCAAAAASIVAAKRAKIRRAAQLYLQQHHGNRWPPCRFDVVLVGRDSIDWLASAFDEHEE